MKLNKKLLPIVLASMLVTSAMAANDVELAFASQSVDTDIKFVSTSAATAEITIQEAIEDQANNRLLDLTLNSEPSELVGNTKELSAIRHLTNDELEAIDGAAWSARFQRLSNNQMAMASTAVASFFVANSITTWFIPAPPPPNSFVGKLFDVLACKTGVTALDVGAGMMQLRAMTVADNRGYDIVDIAIGGALGLILPFAQTGCSAVVGAGNEGRSIDNAAAKALAAQNHTINYTNNTRGLLAAIELNKKFESQNISVEAYINQAKVHRKILHSHMQNYYLNLYLKKKCLQEGAAARNCTIIKNADIAKNRSSMWSTEATINRFMRAAGSVMKQRIAMTGMSVNKITPKKLLMLRAQKNVFTDEN